MVSHLPLILGTWDLNGSNPGADMNERGRDYRCKSHIASVSLTDWCIMIILKKKNKKRHLQGHLTSMFMLHTHNTRGSSQHSADIYCKIVTQWCKGQSCHLTRWGIICLHDNVQLTLSFMHHKMLFRIQSRW